MTDILWKALKNIWQSPYVVVNLARMNSAKLGGYAIPLILIDAQTARTEDVGSYSRTYQQCCHEVHKVLSKALQHDSETSGPSTGSTKLAAAIISAYGVGFFWCSLVLHHTPQQQNRPAKEGPVWAPS